MKFNQFVLVVLFMIIGTTMMNGQTIKGVVTDENGQPLPYSNVVDKTTAQGVTTDGNGNFVINVKALPITLIAKYVGYQNKNIEVTSDVTPIVFKLDPNNSLDEVVVTGNRSKVRSVLNSAVPIDKLYSEDLKSSGQVTFDKMLAYKIPSFNSSSQAISDATAHFDPADLRGLGPSRTLVLVNGKRKNQSALVYINDTPGKGEVGTDMKSIPFSAIERVEVLRDGASSQYGSDAIAGVVNIILKKQTNFTEVSLTSGVTSQGDGFNFGADLNSGFKIADKGFVNFNLSYLDQNKTNRAGTPGKDDLFGVAANDPTWGDWLSKNPDLGMNIGLPDSKMGALVVNAEYPLSEKTTLYAFGDLNIRKGTSFALYRTPYWISDPNNLLHAAGTTYNGFQPTFNTDVFDNLGSVGIKSTVFGFNSDFSLTAGSNKVDYTVGSTLNPTLGANSPTEFNVGGYTFSQLVGNADFSRTFDKVTLGFGTEFRREQFEARAGQSESYTGSGAQSFPGLQPANALKKDRNNVGIYSTLDYDVSEAFLIGGSLRYENYSDFGDNFSWKVNSRYKLNNNITVRGSFSTGFRAPALHQIYLSNVQTLVSGNTISNQGTFNNVDPAVIGLGVPKLHAEKSQNISTGITFRSGPNFSAALDFYHIQVKDRVLFSGEVGFDGDNSTTNPVESILIANNITSMKFFINAVNTTTKGVDIVLNYKNLALGGGKMAFSLASNIANTKIDGQIATPAILKANGYDIFNRKEQGRILSARPNTKVLLGTNYDLKKASIIFNNTYFGDVTWQHATDPTKDQTFSGKIITDLGVAYKFTSTISGNVMVNNLFNVYPDQIDTKGDVVTDLGGRFKYPWEVNQFGFSGTTFSAGLNFKF
ncbi:TonB-dependent receptor [Flavobacterium muglaense]|uniref:TonB-dependent receptor n=1 Tax=Flavobacterium muglaense TaxID=2764716 RepID=A0A923N1X5_9FLAO|nr:TonB-dependent receptor [Flavobacterium muglaense]MBC5838101.1 TonB-dependent receptor [Flavobacterium muglaense]MBC5844595.1 TonB-dependent receptor [Flavobacterium muglaense]